MIGGVGVSSGISGGGVVPTSFSDLLMNGGIAAGIGLLLTVAILYFIALRRRKRGALKLTSNPSPTSFSVINPLKPQAPRSKPPKSAKKSYAETASKGDLR